jgi:hypothetical protein
MREDRRERFLEFLADILRDEGLADVVSVKEYYEDSYDIGYCETCSYIVHEIVITYENIDGVDVVYKLSGTMSDFLS